MWVTGLFDGVGTSSWDLKVHQYVCSGVRGEGPGGSLTGGRGSTGADIVELSRWEGSYPIDLYMEINQYCLICMNFLRMRASGAR